MQQFDSTRRPGFDTQQQLELENSNITRLIGSVVIGEGHHNKYYLGWNYQGNLVLTQDTSAIEPTYLQLHQNNFSKTGEVVLPTSHHPIRRVSAFVLDKDSTRNVGGNASIQFDLIRSENEDNKTIPIHIDQLMQLVENMKIVSLQQPEDEQPTYIFPLLIEEEMHLLVFATNTPFGSAVPSRIGESYSVQALTSFFDRLISLRLRTLMPYITRPLTELNIPKTWLSSVILKAYDRRYQLAGMQEGDIIDEICTKLFINLPASGDASLTDAQISQVKIKLVAEFAKRLLHQKSNFDPLEIAEQIATNTKDSDYFNPQRWSPMSATSLATPTNIAIRPNDIEPAKPAQIEIQTIQNAARVISDAYLHGYLDGVFKTSGRIFNKWILPLMAIATNPTYDHTFLPHESQRIGLRGKTMSGRLLRPKEIGLLPPELQLSELKASTLRHEAISVLFLLIDYLLSTPSNFYTASEKADLSNKLVGLLDTLLKSAQNKEFEAVFEQLLHSLLRSTISSRQLQQLVTIKSHKDSDDPNKTIFDAAEPNVEGIESYRELFDSITNNPLFESLQTVNAKNTDFGISLEVPDSPVSYAQLADLHATLQLFYVYTKLVATYKQNKRKIPDHYLLLEEQHRVALFDKWRKIYRSDEPIAAQLISRTVEGDIQRSHTFEGDETHKLLFASLLSMRNGLA